MNRILMAFALISILCQAQVYAYDNKNTPDETLRKSELFEKGDFLPDSSSYPMPFNEIGNEINQCAVSTGYYFVDSDDQAPDYWRPELRIIDTTTEAETWFKILSGPRIKPSSFWDNNPNGLHFFRNPAVPEDGDFFNASTDSTDDAIAGPIPIGFDFYFNGLKFDSFYVSTNGIIALTNSRYYYDEKGNKVIPAGETSAYNPMSMDWFYPGREHVGNGLNDPVTDDFGYYYSVCGGDPSNPQGGIRARGGYLNQEQFKKNKSALIAPFFGDMHLSQFNRFIKAPEDWGKVYVKRSKNSDKLIIYFINIAPVRTINTPYGQYEGEFNSRPGDINYIAASAQVTLDKRDSSVMVVYEKFDGIAVVNYRYIDASTVFTYNTTVGVHGFARHTNYRQPGGEIKPWAGEYEQYTHYSVKYELYDPYSPLLHNYLAIKFKQWKNVLRAVDISYRVRKKDSNADFDFTELVPGSKVNNYELLAGDERLGAFQPVGIIQNMTNNIQGHSGVNYQKQQLNFRARLKMINEASLRIIYNRLVDVDSTCLASETCGNDINTKVEYVQLTKNGQDYQARELDFPGEQNLKGIPPYGFVQVYFPPFEPNEFVNNHIGRLKVTLIAVPQEPSDNKELGELWPFDDTLNTKLFVLRRLKEFHDNFSSFHVVNRKMLPNTLKWVDYDAEIVDGDDISFYPLPPRGIDSASNNRDFNFQEPDFTKNILRSPAVKMNRLTLQMTEPAESPGGDELRSFPIDLYKRFGAILSLSVQRTAKRDNWPRGYSDQQLVGPEPRTVVNADPFHVFSANGRAASAEPDELVVEFAKPSEDGVNGITNIPEENWRYHPRRGGAKPVTDMPVLSIFGAGGYMVGWLEDDRDSALSRPARPDLNGLRPDIYDDGIDFEFKKFFLAIPDTFIKAENEGAKNFRFRIKVRATNDRKCLACIPDDDDVFFVDNVQIIFPVECTDMELSSVKILWPYTMTPASQAIKIPVRVTVNNIVGRLSPPARIWVKIYSRNDQTTPVYSRNVNVPFVEGYQPVEIPMPYWNARKTGPGDYILRANISYGEPGNPDYDIDSSNDTNYTQVRIKFGDSFAYDPVENPRNDVPDRIFTGIPGRGLNLFGYSYGGMGDIDGPVGGYDENRYGAGYMGGNGSGRIAMKFTLYQQDTLLGYKASFGPLNSSYDDIALSLGKSSAVPNMIVPGTIVYKFRGYDDIREDTYWDEYITYLLPKPVVLDAGTYWMQISQLGETGLELGASKTRMGMRVTSVYIPPPHNSISEVGKLGYHLLVDKTLRQPNNSGKLVNQMLFSYENSRGSGQWHLFTPTCGNPGYAHLHHFGTSPDNYTLTLTRGTWIPMIRPYFGEKRWGDDTITTVHVQSVYFDGISHNDNIELFWNTESDFNKEGFYIQKRIKGDNKWLDIGFVSAEKDIDNRRNYKYIDRDVHPDVIYQYRLRYFDRDGALSDELFSRVVTLILKSSLEVKLHQNVPNPVSNHTTISFTLPQESNVRLEVVDVFGNVVKTLVNNTVNAGTNTVEWNAMDNNNRPVPSGSYIVRLIAGNDVRTMKMTIVR